MDGSRADEMRWDAVSVVGSPKVVGKLSNCLTETFERIALFIPDRKTGKTRILEMSKGELTINRLTPSNSRDALEILTSQGTPKHARLVQQKAATRASNIETKPYRPL